MKDRKRVRWREGGGHERGEKERMREEGVEEEERSMLGRDWE